MHIDIAHHDHCHAYLGNISADEQVRCPRPHEYVSRSSERRDIPNDMTEGGRMVAHLTKPQATASHVPRHRSEDTQRRIVTGLSEEIANPSQ